MARRTPRQARILGLWTAGWLFVLLLAGVLWVGELSLQWPVLAVPVLWALVALRPRRRRDGSGAPAAGGGPRPAGSGAPPPGRYPPTRELPWLPDVPRRGRREE